MNEINQPSYYAIIPSEVRYCEKLKYPERLLYGEITALAGREGYCYATNKYFSELYHVIPGTISRWINHLEKLGFVSIEIIKNDANQFIQRRIYINDNYRRILKDTYEQNCLYPISTIAKYNNIDYKIDRLFNYIIKKEGEILEDFKNEKQYQEFFEVIKRFEFNYTEDLLKILNEENISKVKIIIYCLKEIYLGNNRNLLVKTNREELIEIYDNCKKFEEIQKDTEKEINNFINYYCSSVIRKLKAK